jgi:hypothetical protein
VPELDVLVAASDPADDRGQRETEADHESLHPVAIPHAAPAASNDRTPSGIVRFGAAERGRSYGLASPANSHRGLTQMAAGSF